MKNRKLLLIISVVLALTMSLGGTLAYLTDTDDAVNVMTLGNVDIEQIELQRKDGVAHTGTAKEGALEEFEQNQPLYPAYPHNNLATDYSAEKTDLFYWGPYVTAAGAGNGLWNDEKLTGAIDKFVFVENKGTSDAYYRTLLAFECPEGVEYSQGADKQMMMNVNGHNLFDWENVGYITVDEVRYLVSVATYQQALAAGEISRPSLLQVVMTHNATNEDVAKMGPTYEILALTQACQTINMPDNAGAALDVAFGDVTVAKAAEWFKGVVDDHNNDTEEGVISVSNAKEFVEAMNTLKSGDTIKLANDIELGDVDIVLQDWTVTGTTEENGATVNVVEYANNVYNIDLNTHNLSATAHAIELHGGTLNIKNGTISMDSDTQDGTFITVGGHSPVYDAHKVAKCGQAAYNPASVLNLDNVTFEGKSAVDGGFATSGHAIYVTCHGQVHIRNCTFDLVMENGVYANPFDVYNNASDGVGDGSGSATVVYVYEGTKFYGDPTYQAWKDAVNSDWEVNGGIRVYIADGYKLEAAPIADGDTYPWYTVVKE